VISPDLLKQAEGLRVPITGDDHCLIPVSSDPSQPLVVVASGFARVEPIRRIHELRLQRVAQQLDVLINRMSVIERLEALTRTDALTGVANRRALMERLDHEMRLSRRTGDQFTAVMVDLDFFKRYNDTFGHLAGDAALVSVASMLHNRLRTTDVVARYGGQQFCLLLTDTTAALARQIVDELRRLIGNIDGPQRLTFSAGLAQWDGNETAEELLNRARDAMHHAKSAGRDQCRSSGERRQMRPLVSPRVPPGSISLN
jgi:diguanylate cyclase (GGDEF)-like protein